MFGFFKKKKSQEDNKPEGIELITFPIDDWVEELSNRALKKWKGKRMPGALSLNYFNIPPDLPTMQDVDVLRNMYRSQVSEAQAGIVEAEIKTIGGFQAVRLIIKMSMGNFGMFYLGSLTFPFENCSYVLKIEHSEQGATGVREAIIGNELMASGQVTITDDGFEGWAKDPYQADFKGGLLMNLSEAEKYDERFPDHPLSLVRKELDYMEKHLMFHPDLAQIPSFSK